MPKLTICSECHAQLVTYSKAINKGQIALVVEPHVCQVISESGIDISLEKPGKLILLPASKTLSFDNILPAPKTVNKNNDLRDITSSTGDKRDPKHLREEKAITSTAPQGILSQIKHATHSTPEGDIFKDPKGE